MRVSGWKCRDYVRRCEPFQNNGRSLWSEWVGDIYVVYSYGRHWPLYACWKGAWFKNADRYSRTTSKHAVQAHPLVDTPVTPLSRADMERLVIMGAAR